MKTQTPKYAVLAMENDSANCGYIAATMNTSTATDQKPAPRPMVCGPFSNSGKSRNAILLTSGTPPHQPAAEAVGQQADDDANGDQQPDEAEDLTPGGCASGADDRKHCRCGCGSRQYIGTTNHDGDERIDHEIGSHGRA